MNERIRKLRKQAIEFTNATEQDTDYDRWDEACDAKFAELIIKECTNMLPEDSIRKDGVHMYYIIREHFGISPFRGDGE